MNPIQAVEVEINHQATPTVIRKLKIHDTYIENEHTRRVLQLANVSIKVFELDVGRMSISRLASMYFTEIRPD